MKQLRGRHLRYVAAVAKAFKILMAVALCGDALHDQLSKPSANGYIESGWHVLVSIKNVLARLVRGLTTSSEPFCILA